MNRSERREQLFRLLFRVEFHELTDMREQETLFGEDEETQLSEEDAALICMKYEQIEARLSEIDSEINEKTVGWDTARMGKVDLTIIRLAVFEILFDDEIPTGVAINEAVELAKKYGQDSSASFVNGVLAKFA